MEWKIEIKNRKGVFDPLGNGVKKDIKDLGISGVKKVNVSRAFIISGDISHGDIERIAKELLADPITESYILGNERRTTTKGSPERSRGANDERRVVEIAYNPGVMDPVEESARKAIKDMGIYGIKSLRTEKKYFIEGKITEDDFKNICGKLLYNKVIQHVVKEQREELWRLRIIQA